MLTVTSLDQFLSAYKKGERHFINCELDESSFSGVNLSEAIFEKCFLPSNFSRANCENTQFLDCNLKSADFSEANLKSAVIQGCSVECMSLKEATIENLVFKDNYYMGSTMEQDDLDGFL